MKRANRLLALLVFAVLPARADGKQRNVLLITLDTVRADRLGCYGSPAGLTPNIDSLAARGVVFENAIVPVPETCPSHMTMFTGLYPHRHGVYRNGIPFDKAAPVLAGELRGKGYATGAFVGATHMGQGNYVEGFDLVDREFPGFSRPAASVTAAALPFLGERGPKPFFAWVHYFDAHYPYLPPAAYRTPADPAATRRLRVYLAWHGSERQQDYYAEQGLDPAEKETFRRLIERAPGPPPLLLPKEPDWAVEEDWYDGEIRYVDAEVGRLLAALEASGELKNTLVVLVADHGETLREGQPRFDHGEHLQDREIRVPLVLFDGSGALRPRRVRGQVVTADIFPTVMEALGFRPPAGLDGASLLPAARGRERRPPLAYSSTIGRRLESVRAGRWKLIHDVFNEADALYDLQADPAEQNDVSAAHPRERGELRKDLDAWLARKRSAPSGGEFDPASLDALKALGYLK